ncbi:cytochrome p450 monooxygenase GliC [Clathrospora elynae]|uniref:Cytochrome p450 monooxygenase GliC n=1 Tax=Clathrospora elynae TaxID=706981 RepID=A0A6A5SBL8_9PLEO|nr:cytochrome p450 monooxygenase GliC [Clathrospora elynae]
MPTHLILAAQGAALVAVAIFAIRSRVAALMNKILSTLIDAYLSRRHAWKNIDDGSKFPSCEYVWPNGQGDAAKFLHGQRNSETWEASFGAIYRLWSGMTPEVVVTKPEHVRVVFKDSDKHTKAVNNNSGYMLGQLLGQCVGLVSRDQWKRVRAIVEKPFHRSMATRYVPVVQGLTERYFEDLFEHADLSRGLLDPAGDLKLLPFLIVAEVIYGNLHPDVEKELRDMAPHREALMQYVIQGGLARFQWAKHLPTKANRELAAFQKRWLAVNELAYEKAVEAGISAPIIDYFAARETGQLTTDEMLQTMDEMLFANLDVTIGALSWNVVFLAAYPDIQRRVREEIRAKRAELDAMGLEFDSYITDNNTLLAACVNEAARLKPLAAFSVPQSIPTARVVGGYEFPAGTHFVIDSYALNIRNPYWGDDREKYLPDRFLSGDRTDARYHYWRFGFGPRKCMGQFVADILMRNVLVHLADGYEMGMVKSGALESWGRNVDVWINHPQMQLRCVKR